MIDRIVAEWGGPLERSAASLGREQLRAMLASLRADQLLAASLAGSLSGLREVLDDARPTAAPRRMQIQALGDANQDLVYTPVTPCRLFDTRASQGGMGTPGLNLRRTYGAITPVVNQGGPGGCAAAAGAAVALIQVGTLTPSGSGLLQGGAQGAASFPNALILYQTGDQYGAAVAMPLNPANGQFDLVEQFATADLYGDLLGYFRAPAGAIRAEVIEGPGVYFTTTPLVQNAFSSITETISTTVAGKFQVSKWAHVQLSCTSGARYYFIVVDGVPLRSSMQYVPDATVFEGLLTGVTADAILAGSHTIGVAGQCATPANFQVAGNITFIVSTSSVVVFP